MNDSDRYGSLMISEVWKLMQKCTTPQELFDLISAQKSKSFYLVLRMHFMDKALFKVSRIPHYERNTAPEGLAETNLRIEADRLWGILFGFNLTNETRREILLRDLLSGIDRNDAFLVEHIIESDPGADFKRISPTLREWILNFTKSYVPENV